MSVSVRDFRPLRYTRSIAFRSALIQAASAVLLLAFGWFLLDNLAANLNADGIVLGFGFLSQESGFDVNESLIPYSASHTYGDALLVGFINTVHLTVVCILFSTIIGLFLGFARRSAHWLLNRAALLYVESMRNLPKLLILLAVYVLLVRELPAVRDAWSLFDLAYLSNRGVQLPTLFYRGTAFDLIYALLAALSVVGLLWLLRRHGAPGRVMLAPSRGLASLVLLCAFAVFAVGIGGVGIDVPRFEGFNFSGGAVVSIPFLSLAIALSIYHGSVR